MRHHDHITGKYVGPTCNRCNLGLRYPNRKRKTNTDQGKIKKIRIAETGEYKYVSADNDEKWAEHEYEDNYFLPIVFHNLKSYDAHFVIKHFKKRYTEHNKPNKRATDGYGDDDETDTNTTYGDIIVTPLNGEKYLSFQVGNLKGLLPVSVHVT